MPAPKDEKQRLLSSSSSEENGYGADATKPPGDVGGEIPPQETNGGGGGGEGDDAPAAKRKRPCSKRERLQRNPSLEKVDEDLETEKKEVRDPKRYLCSDYFGVKSYLHNFYDQHVYKDPSVYEDEDDLRFLLHPNSRRRHCTSIWWKVFVWIGANFLIFGIIGVLVGYLVPQKPIIVGSIGQNIELINREAFAYNFNLDVCKLVGLVLFCVGGLTLTVALLFPSFLYNYCDDERRDGAFRVSMLDPEEKPPNSPVEMTVPATAQITGVQPERKQQEAIVTQEGMLPFKE